MHFRRISVKIQLKNLEICLLSVLSSAEATFNWGSAAQGPLWAKPGYPYRDIPFLPNSLSLLYCSFLPKALPDTVTVGSLDRHYPRKLLLYISLA